MSEYDYTCPWCGVTIGTTGTSGNPMTGDIHRCIKCGKLGRIIFAKMVYEVEKAERETEPTPSRPACECHLDDDEDEDDDENEQEGGLVVFLGYMRVDCSSCAGGMIMVYDQTNGPIGLLAECRKCKGYGVYYITRTGRIVTPLGKFNGSVARDTEQHRTAIKGRG